MTESKSDLIKYPWMAEPEHTIRLDERLVEAAKQIHTQMYADNPDCTVTERQVQLALFQFVIARIEYFFEDFDYYTSRHYSTWDKALKYVTERCPKYGSERLVIEQNQFDRQYGDVWVEHWYGDWLLRRPERWAKGNLNRELAIAKTDERHPWHGLEVIWKIEGEEQ